jgi:hypothetical protein
MSLPTQIRPRVGEQLITKVSRLFNGTIADILNELFQNARRADATCVDVDLGDDDGQPTLYITDDGRGIDDPTSFVTLGRSGWSDDVARREDPAGMGVFSLAGRRVTVRSFSQAANAGWSVTIPENGWQGELPLAVETSSMRKGTQIAIAFPGEWLPTLQSQVEAAAKHFPLAVGFRGENVPRKDFLAGAHRIEEWNGCRIGIYRNVYDIPSASRINFHGVKVPCRMPCITEIDAGDKWSARIDIVDAPSLQLVLPARKEMVQNAALDALRVAVQTAIYRTIAIKDEHRLPFRDWQRAAELGIDLPEASAWLCEWRPSTADNTGRNDGPRVEDVPMILIPDHEADIEQCSAKVLTEEAIGYRPVFAQDDFSGYKWYDSLPRIPGLSFRIEKDGRHFDYADGEAIFDHIKSGHVTAITLYLPIVRCAEFNEPIALLGLPVDMLVCANGSGRLEESHVFVREGASVEPPALAQLMEDCCWVYDEDGDNDSWDTQHRDFERDARHFANRLLLGSEEALVEQIRSAFREDVQWLIPKGRALTLQADSGKVELVLAANDPGAGTAAA